MARLLQTWQQPWQARFDCVKVAEAQRNRSFGLYGTAPGTTWVFRNQERDGSSKIHLNLVLSVALPRLAGLEFPGPGPRTRRWI